MKRSSFVVFAAVLALSFSTPLRAQMGMDLFNKPGIADIFKPVVGSGAVYDLGDKVSLELTVVGKDTVDGKEAYWLETGTMDAKSGTMSYGKMLITKGDFQIHRMIFQPPGQPLMELALTPNDPRQPKVQEALTNWHKIGIESITVPAGTFSCDHWTKNDGKSDIWVNSSISPVGLVKETSQGKSMVLVKVITDAKDHLTGTPTTFDPEAIKRQMMEKMQKQQKP